MHEMNTLEIYLKTHNIPYERIDKAPDSFGFDFHKITVYRMLSNELKRWDIHD